MLNIPHLQWSSGGSPNFITGLFIWERKMKILKLPSLQLEILKFIGELYDLNTPLIETAKPKQCNLVQSSNVTSLCAGKRRQAFTCPSSVANTLIPLWLRHRDAGESSGIKQDFFIQLYWQKLSFRTAASQTKCYTVSLFNISTPFSHVLILIHFRGLNAINLFHRY